MSYADKFKSMKPGFDLGRAVAEADRCLLCHDAPCSKGCPAETDPAAFIRKLRFKNITGAIRTIKRNNILGNACGILCPTSRLCEQECSATGIDRPIRIGQIQRFLVEHGWERGFDPFDKAEAKAQKVAVVGSGPAGLSCAAQLAQDGYGVTIFEARPQPGGVLRYGVVAGRYDLAHLEREIEDVTGLGVEIKCDSPIDGPAGAEKLLGEGFDAVFLAPGLWDAKRLKGDGAELDGLYSSVDYLSSLRDGRLDETAAKIKGRTVAVIGGGSVAMDCLESAAKLDPQDVYLVYRRSYAQMPAEADERIEALEAGVHFLLLNQPVDYVADGNKITGLKLVRTKLGAPDDSGRRSPEEIPGSDWVLEADVVIEAIGNQAVPGSPDWYPGVKVDGRKLIQADQATCATSQDGIFAGGDIVRGPDLVVTAVRDGKTAARAIADYLTRREG